MYLKKAFSHIPLDTVVFGDGIKGMKWLPDETLSFNRLLDGEGMVRDVIKDPNSGLIDQKRKAWYVVYCGLKNNHPRLKDLRFEQLRGKFKTESAKFKEPGLNKWNNNCKETGGGMNDMDRPSTPTGDEIVSNETNTWGRTKPQLSFLIDTRSCVSLPSGLADDEELLGEITVTPPPTTPSNQIFFSQTTSTPNTIQESRSLPVPGTSKSVTKPVQKPRKRNIEGEEVKEKKKKMSNEEDNWIRNRRSDILAQDTMKMQQMIRLRHQIEIQVLCETHGISYPQEEIDTINNFQVKYDTTPSDN